MAARVLACYLAAENHLSDMLEELGERPELHGQLAVMGEPVRPIAWAINTWLDPRLLTISSIADGARALRSIQRNWTLYPGKLHRRASLIAQAPAPWRGNRRCFRDAAIAVPSDICGEFLSSSAARPGSIEWLVVDGSCLT